MTRNEETVLRVFANKLIETAKSNVGENATQEKLEAEVEAIVEDILFDYQGDG